MNLFYMDSSFPQEEIDLKVMQQLPTCRTCVYRERFELNDHSRKVIQCCKLQPSKRSNSGYKTIKVTNKACNRYIKNEK